MLFSLRILAGILLSLTLFPHSTLLGQSPGTDGAQKLATTAMSESSSPGLARSGTEATAPEPTPAISRYFDPVQGATSEDLVRRAIRANGDLAAARLDIERARFRRRQAGLRPNPTIEFEQTTGTLTGAAGERELSVGVSLPLEVSGQRKRRIELAEAEQEAVEAEIAERERRLTIEVRTRYAEALAALRELEITENLNGLDLQTTRFVQARVNEGDTAPIELSLLRVEVDRLRSRRALVEGRLQAAIIQLRALAGMSNNDPLRLREELTVVALPPPPASLETAVAIALRTRPDLRLARLSEEVAKAGLRLAQSQARPDVTAFTSFNYGRSVFDNAAVGILTDKDKTLTFGASVSIPVFNRNQGAKAEAAIVISQSQKRREFLEAVIRSEVTSAYVRYEAAKGALSTFEQGVIQRSNDNIRTIRAAYELGQFSVTELIAEQRRLADSQREFTEALSERYRALADLHASLGMASPTQK